MHLTRALVNRLPSSIDDPGVSAFEAEHTVENYHEIAADNIIEALPANGELWVFAIGSLIWNPRCDHTERRPASIAGWQRSFCLGPDQRYRGSPDAPGLMLALSEGGSCQGVAFKLSRESLRENLIGLLKTEPPIPPDHLVASTAKGDVNCIAFTCPKSSIAYEPVHDLDEVAARLASAVGMLGSMPDYLLNAIEHLEAAGIHDPYLWDMQERVAKILENRLG